MGKMEGEHRSEEVVDWTQEQMSKPVQLARFQALLSDLKEGRYPAASVEQNPMESQVLGMPIRLDIPGQREKLLFGEKTGVSPKMMEMNSQELKGFFPNPPAREKFCAKILKTLGWSEGIIRLPIMDPENGLLISIQSKNGDYKWIFCPMDMFQIPQKQRSEVKRDIQILEEYVQGRRGRPGEVPKNPEQVSEGVLAKIKRLLGW